MEKVKPYMMPLVCALLVAVLAILGYFMYQEKEEQKAVTVTQEQSRDSTQLAPIINVTVPQADQIIREANSTQPSVSYNIQAPTVEEAADKTARAINSKDPSLPAAATAKTDRTAVIANTDQQKVDVYKINLQKEHKIKAGVTYVDSKAYLNVGYQAGRVEGIIHFDSKGAQGGTIMYTIAQW